MEENQKHDGTSGGDSNQSENQYSKDSGQGIQATHEELKKFLYQFADVTSLLQDEFCNELLKHDSCRNIASEFSKMSDIKSTQLLEENMKKIMMIVIMCHSVKVNFMWSIFATMAKKLECHEINEIIEEINERSLNDD